MGDEWGISDGYFDVDGEWHVTSDVARARLREAMGTPVAGAAMWFVEQGATDRFWNPCRIVLEDGTDLGPHDALPGDLPIGYHNVVPVDGWPATRLVVHPPTCPPVPSGWGLAVQTYELWSDRSWGVGDLGDLLTVAERLAAAGGSAMLISPLHQPSPSFPQQDSPYYPSSRRAPNPLLIHLDDPPPDHLLCDASELIDRDRTWAAKRAALESCYAVAEPASGPGVVAIWNALCDRFGPSWRDWPEDVRRFDPPALAARLDAEPALAESAAFHQWCQQRCLEQLESVSATGVRLVGDLAVGFSPDGADAWQFQDLLALDMRIGAPPDPFNQLGQEWGIPPFVPWRVRNEGYAPFIDTIRAVLRCVQGLRIDHVMGLFRQYWIPAGGRPADGAYVAFPADELLAILCLEATRAGVFVVGEDLGTVADGVRQALAARNIAGTRVVWFEDDPPSEWPATVLATVTTHDLPTIVGVATGTDGDDEQRERLAALTAATDPENIVADAHAALLASPARLRLMSLDDVCLAAERPNHPGINDEPNWRRRLPIPVDEIVIAGPRT